MEIKKFERAEEIIRNILPRIEMLKTQKGTAEEIGRALYYLAVNEDKVRHDFNELLYKAELRYVDELKKL